MNIVFITPALTPNFGGAPISEASLASSLKKFGSVRVLCRRKFHSTEFSKKFDLNVTEFKPIEFLMAWIFPNHKLNAIFNECGVVHINGHWRWENFFVSRLCLRKGIPYVLHPRGMLLVWHRRIFLKKVFNLLIGNSIVKNASRVIALSQFEVRHFAGYDVSPEKIFVQPNGVSLPEQSKVRKANPLPETPRYLLYIGRLEKRKNLIFLVEAFARLIKEGIDLQLVFIGPVERDYDAAIHQTAEELGISHRLTFLAPVYGDKKWAYIQNAVAVMYPSIEEPFGRVPFEAIIAGSQPVLPDLSGGKEYLEKFIPENIYQSNNLDSLASVLRKVAQGSPKRLDAAREWVTSELDWSRVAASVNAVYGQLCSRNIS